MTTTTTTTAIELNKDVKKYLSNSRYYTAESFERDAKRFTKAIEQGRVICIIGRVSSSGCSRTMKFLSCEVGESYSNYQNFVAFFEAMGYKANKEHYIRVTGGGMDMVFATCYNVIHKLKFMGFIDSATCERLAQLTPTTV